MLFVYVKAKPNQNEQTNKQKMKPNETKQQQQNPETNTPPTPPLYWQIRRDLGPDQPLACWCFLTSLILLILEFLRNFKY